MKVHRIPFQKVPQFSKRDVAYVNQDQRLSDFYKYPVSLEGFQKVIEDKSKEATNRAVLVEVLKEQYERFSSHPKVEDNIDKLALKNTFTIITAHQPSLFTGPLYYIYKIASTINLVGQLREKFPDYNFVPLFITGGEDHDFEEVNHVQLFRKKLVWESGEKGSVGRMKTKTLQPVLAELKEILGNATEAAELYAMVEKSFTNHEFYADATIDFVHQLFAKFGLVILNMTNPKLKALFKPIIIEELTKRPSKPLVEASQTKLVEAGFKAQAFPRPINLFYLDDQIRERIVFEDNRYKVLNTALNFSKEEMLNLVETAPEKFSPNVVLRPIYQELILPNLAYIGGGGELAYWLERKTQFGHFKINFPMLIRRNSVLWLNQKQAKKFAGVSMNIPDLFQAEEQLVQFFVKQNSGSSLELKEEKEALKKTFSAVQEKAKMVDASLVQSILAEEAKQLKALNNLEAKLIKAAKRKDETGVKQIRKIHQDLFPGNSLQERKDNFIPFYIKHGEAWFDTLVQHLDPMQKGMVVFEEDGV